MDSTVITYAGVAISFRKHPNGSMTISVDGAGVGSSLFLPLEAVSALRELLHPSPAVDMDLDGLEDSLASLERAVGSMSEAEQRAYFASVNAWYNLQGFESEPNGAIIDAMMRSDIPPPGARRLTEAVAQWESEVDPNDPRPPHEQVIKRHRA